MLTEATIPPHDIFFRLDHIILEPGSIAAKAVMDIGRQRWPSADEIIKSIDTGSIWEAAWMAPWPAESRRHAASDFATLMAAVTPQQTKPDLADLVNELRVAVRESRDLECAGRAEALRAIAKLEGLVRAPRPQILAP